MELFEKWVSNWKSLLRAWRLSRHINRLNSRHSRGFRTILAFSGNHRRFFPTHHVFLASLSFITVLRSNTWFVSSVIVAEWPPFVAREAVLPRIISNKLTNNNVIKIKNDDNKTYHLYLISNWCILVSKLMKHC